MNKKYMLYQLRSLITTFALMLATLILVGIIESLSARIPSDSDGWSSNLTMIAFSIAAFVLVSALPGSCLRYQFKRQINDTYLQFPFKPKFLRFQSLLMPFLVFLGEVTVSFWLSIAFYYARIAGASAFSSVGSPNPLGYLFSYLLLLVALTGQYLIASFWYANSSSSRVGSFSTSLFTLGLILFAPSMFCLVRSDGFLSNYYLMGGPANFIVLYNNYIAPITAKSDIGPLPTLATIEIIISTCLTYLCAAGAVLFLVFRPERKGELAGSKTPSSWYEKLPIIFGLISLVALNKTSYGLMLTITIPLIFLNLTFAFFLYSIYDYRLKITGTSGIMLGIQAFLYVIVMLLGVVSI